MQDLRLAAVYCRISTLIHGQDINNQLIPIREFAQARGYRIFQEYADEGISGVKERRPALDQMISDARRGKFKYLIVMEISRLARDVRHLLNLLHELDHIGVAVISLREGIEMNSPLGKAMVAMIGIFSGVERDLLRERIKSSLAAKRIAAEQAGKRFNIGRPMLADNVVFRVKALRSQGHSIRAIAKELGIGKTSVERILRGKR